MFPWGHFVHALAHSLNRDTYCTHKGTALKTVQCEACQSEYVYRISREAVGHSSGFLWPDYETANQRASKELRKLLERGCDPVPCPACGWYQRNMVKRARQLRYAPLVSASVVLFFIAGLMTLFVLIAALADTPTAQARRNNGEYFYLFLTYGVILAAAAVCLALRFLLAWSFDPNAATVESRIQLGRWRTLKKQSCVSQRPGLIVYESPPRHHTYHGPPSLQSIYNGPPSRHHIYYEPPAPPWAAVPTQGPAGGAPSGDGGAERHRQEGRGHHPPVFGDVEKPRAEAEGSEHRLRLDELYRHQPILRGDHR